MYAFPNYLFIGLDSDTYRNERLDVENDGQKHEKEREPVEDTLKDKGLDGESVAPASLPHSQPGSPHPPEGMEDSGRKRNDIEEALLLSLHPRPSTHN